jgi:hypothetical protein
MDYQLVGLLIMVVVVARMQTRVQLLPNLLLMYVAVLLLHVLHPTYAMTPSKWLMETLPLIFIGQLHIQS